MNSIYHILLESYAENFFRKKKKNTNERKYSLDTFNSRTNVTFAPHAYTYAHARRTIRGDVDTGQGT